MSGALDPKIQQEIIDRDLYATAVLSGNRNFDGRIHPYAKRAFLASPPLVIAYAIAGTVRFDIEKGRARHRPERRTPVTLKDIWPSDEEIDAVIAKSVKPEQFRKVYEPMFTFAASTGEKISPLYDWRAPSTYIRRPPYWEGALAGERTLRGLRPLAVLPDNITTDHLSPSNAILGTLPPVNTSRKNGPAGRGLQQLRHASRRPPHRAARHFRQPAAGERNGHRRWRSEKGSLARVEPDGKVMRMWEAIETYMDRKQPLIIIAGADYGRAARATGPPGRAPCGRGSDRGGRLRAYPPYQPDRHGRTAA